MFKLKPNIALKGRILRFSVALLLLAFAIWKHSLIALIASLFTFFEACFSWCIVYQLLGKNECPINRKKK